MRVESLVYRPTFGGLRHGLFTLELRVGSEGPTFGASELVGHIYNAASTYSPMARLLTIRDYWAENDPSEVMELVSSLADTFEITAEVTGYRKPGWIALANRKRVLIGDDPWLRYQTDEIFYEPSTEDFVPPQVGPANVNAMRYLMVKKGTNAEKVMKFMQEAPLPWMILSKPVFTVEVRIL